MTGLDLGTMACALLSGMALGTFAGMGWGYLTGLREGERRAGLVLFDED